MWTESWLDELPRALRSVWAASLGPLALDIWWGAGDRERTYKVASWLPQPDQRYALCFYAFLDPEPSSKRVLAAVQRAFRRAGIVDTIWLVGVTPVGPPELQRILHSHITEDGARMMFGARMRGEVTSHLKSPIGDEAPLREAWTAAFKGQSLGPAWEKAVTYGEGWRAPERLMLLPTRARKEWSALPKELPEPDRGRAAFVAALSSEAEAAEVLSGLDAFTVLPCCRAALARRDVPAAWAQTIREIADPSTLYEEGLYSSEDRFTVLAAKAACESNRAQAIDAVLVQMMLEAQAEAARWCVELTTRLSGQRDEARIAERVEEVKQSLAEPKPSKYGVARRLAELAAAGGRPEAVPFVEELERRGLLTFRALASAAGRSLSLSSEELGSAAELTAALAADGHLDAAKKQLEKVLDSKPPAEDLLLVLPAVLALEPECAATVNATMTAELEKLPGANEGEARAWLSGSPDD